MLDFDSTISQPTYIPWDDTDAPRPDTGKPSKRRGYVVADDIYLFEKMSDEEIVRNFGGQERIE